MIEPFCPTFCRVFSLMAPNLDLSSDAGVHNGVGIRQRAGQERRTHVFEQKKTLAGAGSPVRVSMGITHENKIIIPYDRNSVKGEVLFMNDKIQTGLRVPAKQYDRLSKKADKMGVSLNALILMLIDIGLETLTLGAEEAARSLPRNP